MNDYNEAKIYYEAAIGKYSNNANYYEGYGDVLYFLEKYDKSIKEYKNAKLITPKNKVIQKKIARVNDIKGNNNTQLANIITREDSLNTEYSEYGLGWYNNDLVFASMRISSSNKKIDDRTSQGFSNLYISKYNHINQTWQSPVLINGAFNSKYNDGTFVFDKTNNMGLSMQCNKATTGCILVQASYDEKKNAWVKGEPISLNNTEYSVGHPTISENGDILYFVSDMPGGFGGKDVWKANRKKDGTWGIPINVGKKINTTKDEMFPHIINDSLLFFASNGHFGYGGLDIFYSVIRDYDFSTPVNIGLPFNSSSDDFGVIMKYDNSSGLFCSNRNNEYSDDIYSFDGFPLTLSITGLISDSNTYNPIDSVAVIFTSKNRKADTIYTNSKGVYTYPNIQLFQKYNIKTSKPNYFANSTIINNIQLDLAKAEHENRIITQNFTLEKSNKAASIKGIVTDRATGAPVTNFELTISGNNSHKNSTYTDINGMYIFSDLKPKATYTVTIQKRKGYFGDSRICKVPNIKIPTVFSKQNGVDMDFKLTKIEPKKEITLDNIYYDFDKSTLRLESKKELNKLASMLIETPNVSVQINSHTDARGKASYNQKLSDARAKSVVNYLISKGINVNRLISKGYGEQQLLIKNATTDKEHQANRRTTFSVVNTNNEINTSKINNSNNNHSANNNTINSTSNYTDNKSTTKVTYRIQLLSTNEKLNTDEYFKSILNSTNTIFITKIGNTYKYEIGLFNSISKASSYVQSIKSKYPGCFITSYYGNNKISTNEAVKMQ
jgi:outer membrane protein OmpA-like peptidoglycan-associated protein/tetratricopeptide (TPR) repeat protein